MKSELINKGSFNRVMNHLRKFPKWVVDTETTGLDSWHGDRVCGMVLGTFEANSPGYYFPVRHDKGTNLPWHQYETILQVLAEREICTGWNYKFDLHMMMADGLPMPERLEDVMLAAHLMDENEMNFRLKDLATKYLGPWAKVPEEKLQEALTNAGLGSKGQMWMLDPRDVEEYAGADVVLTRRMRRLYMQGLKDWKLDQLWQEINEYVLVTTDMERNGIRVDPRLIKEYAAEARVEAERSVVAIQKSAGYPINLNSPKQLQAWMNVPTTAKAFLDEMKDPPPEVALLLEHRAWEKVLTSYYNVWLDRIDTKGIIHTSILLHGTVAGRPSSRDPNLQAIPRKSDRGVRAKVYNKVKNVIIARPGHTFVSADYSQAELRLGAHLINDPVMKEILASGADIHQEAAELMDLERDVAKRINFGAFYGAGAKKLAKERKVALKIAQDDLRKYHGTFKNIQVAYTKFQAEARARGYIRMWTGRIRRYFTIRGDQLHRKALSNKVQGGVAEMMRITLTRLRRETRPGGRLVGLLICLQVHDQILFEIPNAKVKRYLPVIKEIMEDFPQFYPLPKVDISYGPSWGTLEKWQPKEKAA